MCKVNKLMRTIKQISRGATITHIFCGPQHGRTHARLYRKIETVRLSHHRYTSQKSYTKSLADMDSSMVESVIDDGENSDYFSPAPAAVSDAFDAT